MITTFYDSYQILSKVYKEGAFLKQAILTTVIEEKNRPLVTKVVYGVLDKDIELEYYIKKLTDKSPKPVIKIILKIAMYAIKWLQKKPYAVIDNSVELVKKMGKKGVSGFVNATLRRFCKEEVAFPADFLQNLSIKYSFPLFYVKELIKDYGKEVAEEILSAETINTTVCFYNKDGEEYLKERKIEYEVTPFENVFLTKNFIRNEDYDKGLYTFQNVCSVAICDLVKANKNLLDACAAPGGKSINLSRRFESVISCDLHEHRVNLIEKYAKRIKVTNVFPKVQDMTNLNEEFIDKFDVVLCDSPCTGSGVFNENPDMKINKGEENLKDLVVLQNKILENVKNYVKIGGYLYYSTCSLFKRENICQVEKFLKENGNFELVPIESKWKGLNEKGTIQFLPNLSTAGFFVACLKRIS
ncbi:MAG: methyltransferase domain-containing protein [Clostridiales bacterium]|nr:methyltransferase domain-containing protein [Clostridiales bacterium]